MVSFLLYIIHSRLFTAKISRDLVLKRTFYLNGLYVIFCAVSEPILIIILILYLQYSNAIDITKYI